MPGALSLQSASHISEHIVFVLDSSLNLLNRFKVVIKHWFFAFSSPVVSQTQRFYDSKRIRPIKRYVKFLLNACIFSSYWAIAGRDLSACDPVFFQKHPLTIRTHPPHSFCR